MEESFGIIPCRLHESGWEFLLVQHKSGHWGFPKGHALVGEAPVESAVRELQEETGLMVDEFLFPESFEECYSPRPGVEKRVTYFVARVSGEVKIDRAEIQDYVWIAVEKAAEKITFPASQALAKAIALKNELNTKAVE